jgi:hypothetical protein
MKDRVFAIVAVIAALVVLPVGVFAADSDAAKQPVMAASTGEPAQGFVSQTAGGSAARCLGLDASTSFASAPPLRPG